MNEPLIYLDHNIIAGMAGIPEWPNAPALRAAALALARTGFRFALSAWNIYELARSSHDEHVRRCSLFVDQLKPVWIGNNHFIKRQEIARWLAARISSAKSLPEVGAVNETVARMWATYGGPVLLNETLGGSVLALRSDPANISRIDQAAAETPEAIATGRRAMESGWLKPRQSVSDREYFRMLMPDGYLEQDLDQVLANIKSVLTECPTVAVEEALSQVRLRDGFKPLASHASDLQHALAALAYCQYFGTDDKQLREHCGIVAKHAGRSCVICRSVDAIPLPA